MPIQELPTAPPELPLSPPSTPQDKINRSVQDGTLTKGAGETLTGLFSAHTNHSPEDIKRHEEMMEMVIKNAASAGKRILH